MHRHFCETYGHDYECGEDCECICGLSMEGNDHSDCPVELRPCPEHQPEAEHRILEAMFSADTAVSAETDEPRAAAPHCECGCADIDSIKFVGWCFWCDHVYSEWNLEIQARHFAHHCPEASNQHL